MEESAKFNAAKFIKEFDEIAGKFIQQGKEPKFDYLSTNEILKSLGFLTKGIDQNASANNNIFSKERGYIFKLIKFFLFNIYSI